MTPSISRATLTSSSSDFLLETYVAAAELVKWGRNKLERITR
jgi:hypothetical protein